MCGWTVCNIRCRTGQNECVLTFDKKKYAHLYFKKGYHYQATLPLLDQITTLIPYYTFKDLC